MSGGIPRRPNGSIVGANVIPTTTYPSTAYGIWDKNEQYSLNGIGYWPGFGGAIVTYSFTSNYASATFFGTVLTGNPGSSGYYVGGTGGGYSITNNSQHVTATAGVNGGNGSSAQAVSGYDYGGGGGGIGGSNSSAGSGAGGADFNGLWTAVTLGGYTGSSTFGAGTSGGLSVTIQDGHFAGGGGGGVNPGYHLGAGGNAAVVIQCGDSYATVINQSSGAGSFTCPGGSTYVKIWCIGRGANGSTYVSFPGGGGGAGGMAYARFD